MYRQLLPSSSGTADPIISQEWDMLVEHNNYEIFKTIGLAGHYNSLNFLYLKLSKKMQEYCLREYATEIVTHAARHNYDNIIDFFVSRVPRDKKEAIKTLALQAQWDILTPEQQHQKLTENNFEIFRLAVNSNNDVEAEFYLNQATPEQRERMLADHDDIIALSSNLRIRRHLPRARPRDQRVFHSVQVGDLQAEADNPESAMVELTEVQQLQLEAIEEHYALELDTPEKIQHHMSSLRELLVRRYHASPAKVRTGDGREIILPLDFSERESLLSQEKFSADTRENIDRAYYQHEVHTAYRYLLENNHWLHPEAIFVKTNHKKEKQTLFKRYEKIIALMFIAAQDGSMMIPGGASCEDRLTFFITQMGDIARAHNRERTNIEQYDNLEADNPSCELGTTRRLFFSVIGHPLLQPLDEMIKALVHEQIKEHFVRSINTGNCDALLNAWRTCFTDASEGDLNHAIAVLKGLDLSSGQIEQAHRQIINSLKQSFKNQPRMLEYFNNPEFLSMIKRKLELAPGFDCYAFQFNNNVGLQNYLEGFIAKSAAEPSKDELRSLRLKHFGGHKK